MAFIYFIRKSLPGDQSNKALNIWKFLKDTIGKHISKINMPIVLNELLPYSKPKLILSVLSVCSSKHSDGRIIAIKRNVDLTNKQLQLKYAKNPLRYVVPDFLFLILVIFGSRQSHEEKIVRIVDEHEQISDSESVYIYVNICIYRDREYFIFHKST